MWCNSPRISAQSACAMLVLPTPDGPTNSQADGYGCAANLARMRFGFSRPNNLANVRGLYFSASDCGNGRVGALIARPPECNQQPSALETLRTLPSANRS